MHGRGHCSSFIGSHPIVLLHRCNYWLVGQPQIQSLINFTRLLIDVRYFLLSVIYLHSFPTFVLNTPAGVYKDFIPPTKVLKELRLLIAIWLAFFVLLP